MAGKKLSSTILRHSSLLSSTVISGYIRPNDATILSKERKRELLLIPP